MSGPVGGALGVQLPQKTMKPFLLFLTVGLSLPLGLAQTTGDSTVPLFDFRQPGSEKGWAINIFKGHPDGGRGHAVFEPSEDAELGRVARLTSESAARFNLISPEITLPSKDSNLIGFQIEYRTGGDSEPLALIICDSESNIYSAPLPPTGDAWETRTITSFPNSQKGTPPLDLRKLRKIYIRGAGNVDVSIAFIQLVFGEREIPLTSLSRPLLVVPEAEAPAVLDGKLDEKMWGNAAVISDLPVVSGDLEKEKFPTEIRVFRAGSKLCLGAKLAGEPAPASGNGTPDHNVWKDSSIEVFLKPDRGEGPAFQLIVNSLNTRQDYQGSDATWNGPWKSAVAKEGDGWNVEMEIDLAGFDQAWNEHSPWRWNVVRNVAVPGSPAKHGIAFRAGLGGSVLTTRGALLAFAPARENPDTKGFSVIKTGPEEYALNLPTAQKKTSGAVRIFRVVDDRGDVYAGKIDENSPLKLTLKDSGLYHLEIEENGPRGTEVTLLEFFASNPVQTKWDDVVLWPTPRKLEIGKTNLPLSQVGAVGLRGEGDAFPAEHLRREIERRYGPLGKVENGVGIDLSYDPKIAEEGYQLSVDAGGVKLRASSGRGMYYGVRTLLDLIAESSLDLSNPQIRYVQCEDGPRSSKRVLYYYLGVSRYKTPTSVEAVKRFIYNEVAGGRYNLMFLMVGNGYQYAAVPKIRAANAWTKEQLREVIDFARQHYVEVAPGGESPGHANWLIPYYPELGDEGDTKTLDLGNPEALKTLLACYDELLDIFKPRYFHTGGDEFRLKWTEKSRSAEDRRALLLAHWRQLNEHFKAKGVQMLMWDDMVSPKWNGGPPLEAAKILDDLPRDIILCSWSDRGLDNPPALYDKLGFKEHWKITTSFDSQRADRSIGWWKDYEGLGLGIFTAWPWTAFVHSNYITHTKYTAAALHLNALLLWHPESLARGAEQVLANDGAHWMRAMSPPGFGRTDLRIQPIPLANTPAQPVPPLLEPALAGFMKDTVGELPYRFETKTGQAVIAAASGEKPAVIPVSQKVAGFFFLQTTAVAEKNLPELYKEFRYENTNPIGLEIGSYEIHFEDGDVESAPVILGYNVHFYNAVAMARILEGSPAYFTSIPTRHANTLPAAWVMTWKNPRPEVAVKEVRCLSRNAYAPLALLGVSVVGVTQ